MRSIDIQIKHKLLTVHAFKQLHCQVIILTFWHMNLQQLIAFTVKIAI